MDKKEPIATFFDHVNSRDLERMGSLLSSEVEFYFPKTQPLLGKARVLRFFGILFKQYSQLTFEIQQIIRQDDKAAVHWTNNGINRRKEPYQNEGVSILRLQGEKIIFISDFFKDTEKF